MRPLPLSVGILVVRTRLVPGAKFSTAGNPQLVGAIPNHRDGQPRTSTCPGPCPCRTVSWSDTTRAGQGRTVQGSGIQWTPVGHHSSFAPETRLGDGHPRIGTRIHEWKPTPSVHPCKNPCRASSSNNLTSCTCLPSAYLLLPFPSIIMSISRRSRARASDEPPLPASAIGKRVALRRAHINLFDALTCNSPPN